MNINLITETTPTIEDIHEWQTREGTSLSQSEQVTTKVISNLIQNAEAQHQENTFMNRYFNKFSSSNTLNKINEVGDMLHKMDYKINPTPKQEEEPSPLYVDSLLPISADIDAENDYKERIGRMGTLGESVIRVKNKGKESRVQRKQSREMKLDMTEVSEEDGLTLEMRRQEDEKQKKLEAERKVKENIDKLKRQKLKGNKNKEVGYDYNGEVLEVKVQNKTNLIASILTANAHAKTNIIKDAVNDPSPTKLEGHSGKLRAKKMEGGARRKDEIEFSEVRSLADQIKTNQGVKYSYEGKTYEEKKRTVTMSEIKKSLSSRRLSKEEFNMLQKSNGNNRQELEQSNKKSRVRTDQERPSRTQSETKFGSSRLKKAAEVIHINSNVLKAKLLEKVIKLEEEPKQKHETDSVADSELKLDRIDRFNINYMTNGAASLEGSTSKEFFGQKGKTQLPRIAHTTLSTKTMPKGREKIKDSNQILREMRKRFEDKLRV